MHTHEVDRWVFDAVGAAVIVSDLAGNVVSWNPAAERLYGWTEAEAIGAGVGSLLGIPLQNARSDVIMAAVADGASWTGEWSLQARNGTDVPVRVTTTPLRDSDGLIVGVVGVAVSIAEELGAREALKTSERRFRALVARASDGIAVLDAAGLVSYVSPSLCEAIGAEEADILGRPGGDYVEPLEVEHLRAVVSQGTEGSEIGPIAMHLRCVNGALLPYEGYRTDRLVDNDVAGIVWNLRDLSATQDAQLLVERSDERLQALLAGSSDVTMVIDADGIITYAGASVERAFGYRPEELVGTLSSTLVHEDDLVGLLSLRAAISSHVSDGGAARFRFRHHDGTWRWIETRLTDLLANPAVSGLVANIRDVTDQHIADEALRESEQRYRSIVQTAGEGIWIHDTHGRTTFANPTMASLLATTVGELHERSLFEFVEPADREFVAAKLAHLAAGQSERYEFAFTRADGSRLEALISASPQYDANGLVTGSLKMVTDIGDRVRAEAENARLALEDSLTGLASRALVTDRVSQVLARRGRNPALTALLFIDLDNFKSVNDSLGHIVGDQLLCHVARGIRSVARPQDTVGRYGGDEFIVVLDDLETVADAIAVAERIAEVMRVPMRIEGTEVLVSASIGIALTPAVDADSLMRDADTAMYQAKERGGARYELFEFSLRARAVARLELEGDLRCGIELHQFCVEYQPVVELSGKVVGFEALARWEHPTRGLVSPGEFIPLAESTGLIVELGAWILDQACRDTAGWRATPGNEQLTVAVNLSGRQLTEPNMADVVAGILTTHGLSPGALCLEITESILMDDNVAATEALTRIHDLGVRLAVDDFGTGYSSLLYLRRFPVDALKLDRFFVAGIDRNAEDPAIVRAVIDLAHSLGLHAVAEGVETTGQLEALRTMGCDYAQGFLFSPGVRADKVGALLAAASLVPAPPAMRSYAGTGWTVAGLTDDADLPATTPVSVLVVDGSDGDRGLLYSYLEGSGSFRVVGDAADGETGVALAARTKPDLALLDMSMLGMDGLETLPHLLRASPTTRVVIFSGFVSAGLRDQAIAGGAVAVLDRDAPFPTIVAQLRSLAFLPEARDTAAGRKVLPLVGTR